MDEGHALITFIPLFVVIMFSVTCEITIRLINAGHYCFIANVLRFYISIIYSYQLDVVVGITPTNFPITNVITILLAI